MTQKTRGIVIKRMNFGEADRILTVLTDRFGKVKAIAKGVRKGKSRLAGHLEPFMNLNLQLHEGKTFYIVTGAEIIDEFPSLHEDLKKTSQCFYVSELIDKFLQENQRIEGVFEIFLSALSHIEERKSDFWLRVFELKLIELAGFHPELFECVHCKNKLKENDNFWDNLEGGVICSDCRNKFHHGEKISDEAIKFFRFIEKNNVSKIEQLKVSDAVKNEAQKILKKYIDSILEKEIKSEAFMRKISREN